MMPDANHAMAGPSTYPFGIIGGAFAEALALDDYPWSAKSHTVVGNDVWLGRWDWPAEHIVRATPLLVKGDIAAPEAFAAACAAAGRSA